MANYTYYQIARQGLEIYISKFPEDTGNLKYNATKLKSFKLNRDGATWIYNTSGSSASYAEPVNDGYEQFIFGKRTGKRVDGKFFYEKGTIMVSRYLQNKLKFGNLAGKRDLEKAKRANYSRNLDSDARKLRLNRSITLVENGQVKIGEPSGKTVKVGD